jgi:hypothetical protein
MTAENPAFKSQLKDNESLSKWILRRLGSPIWKVELTQEHLDDAIEDAKRWFAEKKGLIKLGIIDMVNGRPNYPLPDEVNFIIDVAFEQSPADMGSLFSPFLLMEEEIPYDVFAAPQSLGLYSTYVQSLAYIETAKRVLGAELEWWQQDRQIYFAPTPAQSRKVIYIYKTSVFAIDQLSERDHNLIKKYALALAMRDLGRIRSKYDSFPTAQGTQSLDGDRLMDQANEMIEKLDEEIILTGYPMYFLTG